MIHGSPRARLYHVLLLIGLAPLSARAQVNDPGALARTILDDARPRAEREALIADHPELSEALIVAMTADLPQDAKEEYRRIPWIWRVAIAGGKRNDPAELKKLLGIALPRPGQPLEDWQAVVIGGGLINGVSLVGAWPDERFATVLQGDPQLAARWRRAIDLAATMADDANVPTGTRYDALRLLGVEPWERRGAHLARYLGKDVHPELQMGAVSALADVRSPEATKALLGGLAHYAPGNRDLALDALVRDDARALALLNAIESGTVKAADLGSQRTLKLTKHANENIRDRANLLLK